jgi:hypothetical protein
MGLVLSALLLLLLLRPVSLPVLPMVLVLAVMSPVLLALETTLVATAT